MPNKMLEKWEEKTLDDVCKINYGTRVVKSRDAGTIYPVYGGGGATFSMNTFNREDCMVVARFAMSEKCTRFVKGKFFLNDSGLTVETKISNLNQNFIDWQLISLNDKIYSLGRGSAQKNLNVDLFKKIQIKYPTDVEEQQRIVGILDEAFENIEKAKQNALQNLNNAKELSNTRLNTLINTLTELYDILKLKDITTKLGDGLHGTPEFNTNGNVYFINGSNLNDGSITIKPDTKLTTEEEFKKYKKELNDRTILVSINGTVGNVAFYNNEKIILGKSACYFNLKENISKEYIKQLIQSNYFLTYANKNASEMTIKNVSLETMRGFPVPMPPLREQEKVSRHIKELQEQTKKLEQIYEQKIKDLDELKQSILQKAFNGEL